MFQFGSIYDGYVGGIYRYTFYKLGEQAVAEETTYMIFEKAWQDFKRFKKTNRRPRIWLYRFALDSLNSSNGHQNGSDLSNECIQLIDGTGNIELRRAILALPPQGQDFVILHDIEELPDRDISEIMGTQPEDIRLAVTLARTRLLELLGLQNTT